MKIHIIDNSESYILDDSCDLSETWMFNCQHDQIIVDEDGLWCPSCRFEDMNGDQLWQLQQDLLEDPEEFHNYRTMDMRLRKYGL